MAASRSRSGSSSPAAGTSGTSSTRTSVGRVTPVSRRSRSTARLWAMVISQVDNLPRLASNRAAFRQAVRNTSCVSSSAASELPSSRIPSVKIGRANRAYSPRMASSFPASNPSTSCCSSRASSGPSVRPFTPAFSFRYTGLRSVGAWDSGCSIMPTASGTEAPNAPDLRRPPPTDGPGRSEVPRECRVRRAPRPVVRVG
jgi:hypothetical protein